MPVHNGEAVLDQQLDALAAQRFDRPWELVVSDNGSDDGTRALLRRRRESFPAQLRIIDSGARPGAAFARNAAIRQARAERLAFCDSDDRLGPEWLAGAYEALDRFDVVGGPMRRLTDPFDPDSPKLAFHSVSEHSMVTSNVAARTELIRRVGGFDATFWRYGREDHELSVRLWKVGAEFGYEPRMLVYYRLTDDPVRFLRKIYSSCEADTRVWRRHPDVFPDRQGRGFVAREALALPVNLARAAGSGGPRRMARVVVNLVAHARRMLPPRRPLDPPMLLGDMHEETPEVTTTA